MEVKQKLEAELEGMMGREAEEKTVKETAEETEAEAVLEAVSEAGTEGKPEERTAADGLAVPVMDGNYLVHVPEFWDGMYHVAEPGDSYYRFEYKDTGGGLFEIEFYDRENEWHIYQQPDYEILGNWEKGVVAKFCPTDVQGEEEDYFRMTESVPLVYVTRADGTSLDPIQSDEMVFPNSHRKLITEEELNAVTAEQLRIGRNEIYALAGKEFKDKELQSYFESKRWYTGGMDEAREQEMIRKYGLPPEFYLHDVTKENIRLIQEREAQLELEAYEQTPEGQARREEITGSDHVIDESDCDWFQMDTSEFVHPSEVESSVLFGTWGVNTSDWTEESIREIGIAQWSPYLIFCKDGTLVYQFGDEIIEGTYRINPEDDVFCAIGNLDGREVKVSVYQMVMSVTNMPMIKEKAAGVFKTTIWGFEKWSESEEYGLDPWLE